MKPSKSNAHATLLEPSDSEVYLAVLGRIQRGEIQDGDRLVDTTLAAEFGLSRMPVRQALLRLVHEGYLAGTTRGFVLPQLSDRDVEEIFEVRLLLEPRAAASACLHLSGEQLDALRAAYRDAGLANAAGDPQAMMVANDRFRQIWLEAVPNRRMAATIQRFVDHVLIVRRHTIIDREIREVILKLFKTILDGFERRDCFHVHDAMAQFVARGRDSYFARFKDNQTSKDMRSAVA